MGVMKSVLKIYHNIFKSGKPIIDNDGRFLGKYDVFKPLFLIIFITLVFFIARVLLQKDQYVTVELYASGGEWWFDNPEPPYWLTDPIKKGEVEYDPQGGKLVEILDTQKFEVGQRKMLWIKAKLKVVENKHAKQFRFRREPLQIGSVIYIAPSNIKVYCNVLSVEGTGAKMTETEHIVTLKEYEIFPWHADAIHVGDKMKDDEGKTIAEIIDKKTVDAEMLTTDSQGNTHVRSNPLRKDLTLKLRLKTINSAGIDYFSYFQPIKIGFYLWIPFEKVNVSGNVLNIE